MPWVLPTTATTVLYKKSLYYVTMDIMMVLQHTMIYILVKILNIHPSFLVFVFIFRSIYTKDTYLITGFVDLKKYVSKTELYKKHGIIKISRSDGKIISSF